ncbi:MAG: hypothetical protein WBA92_18405, partial [Pseudorhodobacter sp.]
PCYFASTQEISCIPCLVRLTTPPIPHNRRGWNLGALPFAVGFDVGVMPAGIEYKDHDYVACLRTER